MSIEKLELFTLSTSFAAIGSSRKILERKKIAKVNERINENI
jgi:hypothetical protein